MPALGLALWFAQANGHGLVRDPNPIKIILSADGRTSLNPRHGRMPRLALSERQSGQSRQVGAGRVACLRCGDGGQRGLRGQEALLTGMT